MLNTQTVLGSGFQIQSSGVETAQLIMAARHSISCDPLRIHSIRSTNEIESRMPVKPGSTVCNEIYDRIVLGRGALYNTIDDDHHR